MCSKLLIIMISCIVLYSCTGGASDSGSTKLDLPLSMSLNGTDVNTLDHVENIGITKFNIKNNGNDKLIINSLSILNDNVDTIDNKNTTCISALNAKTECLLSINLQNVYIRKTKLDLNIVTNEGTTVRSFYVWNYNVEPTGIPNLTLEIESNLIYKSGQYIFDHESKLEYQAENIKYTVYNKGRSAIYIDNIKLNTTSKYDSLTKSQNLCNGTLYPNTNCSFYINYGDVGELYNSPGTDQGLHESITINYRGGVLAKKYLNITVPPIFIAKYNCYSVGKCNIQFTNLPKNHKIIITKYLFTSDPISNNLSVKPSESGGCILNNDISQNNSCSFDISTIKLPVDYYSEIWFDYDYYINDTLYAHSKHTSQENSEIRITATDGFKVTRISNWIPSLCANRGGQKSQFWQDGWITLGAWSTNTYTIKNIKFIPAANNIQNYKTGELISQNDAIETTDCIGATINNHKTCTIRLLAGCEALPGSAGNIQYTYTIDANPQEFIHTEKLPEIAQPGLNISAGEGDNFKYIWQEGQTIPTNPIHIAVPPSILTGINFDSYNWYEQSTYFGVGNEYLQYMTPSIPNCLGGYGISGNTLNFIPTGSLQFGCGVSYDFSKQPSGSHIPTTITFGTQNQITLKLIWDIK